jgi:histidine phosphotransferase ChpT
VTGEVGEHPIDAHGIQPFYTGLLARTCGLKIEMAQDGETVTVIAQ